MKKIISDNPAKVEIVFGSIEEASEDLLETVSDLVKAQGNKALTITISLENALVKTFDTLALIEEINGFPAPVMIEEGTNLKISDHEKKIWGGFYRYQTRRLYDIPKAVEQNKTAPLSATLTAYVDKQKLPIQATTQRSISKTTQALPQSQTITESKKRNTLVPNIALPNIELPPEVDPSQRGSVEQLFPFSTSEIAQLDEFVKTKQPHFDQLFNTQSSPLKKKEALEKLADIRLPEGMSEFPYVKMGNYLLEMGIEATQELAKQINQMNLKQRESFVNGNLKRSTRWATLLHPGYVAALTAIRSMSQNEIEWWTTLSLKHMSEPRDSNLADLMNKHKQFINQLHEWGLKLPVSPNVTDLHIYQAILEKLKPANNKQKSLNWLIEQDLNLVDTLTLPEFPDPLPETPVEAQAPVQPQENEEKIIEIVKKPDPLPNRNIIQSRLTETGVSSFLNDIKHLLGEQLLSPSEQRILEEQFRTVLVLSQTYRFREQSEALRDLSDETLTEEFGKIISDYREKPESVAQQEMLALLCEVMFRSTGYFPYPSQILTVLLAMRNPQNTLLAIHSEQEKTIVNRLLAVMNYAFHNQKELSPVVISSDNMYQAKVDYAESAIFLKSLGIDCQVVSKKTPEDVLGIIAASNPAGKNKAPSILFSTAEDLGLHLLALKEDNNLPSLEDAHNSLHAVMQFKGDAVIYDRISDLAITRPTPERDNAHGFAYDAACKFIVGNDFTLDISSHPDQVMLRSRFRDYLSFHHPINYQNSEISDQFIDELFDATVIASQLKENRDYMLTTNSRIVALENGKEDRDNNLIFKQGIQQALLSKLRAGGKSVWQDNPGETVQSASTSQIVRDVFSRSLITTSSLTDKKDLEQAKQFLTLNDENVIELPNRRRGALHFLPTEFASTKRTGFFGDASFVEAIQRNIDQHLEQPHLIMCQDTATASKLHDQLRHKNRLRISYPSLYRHPQQLGDIAESACKPGHVTVVTPQTMRDLEPAIEKARAAEKTLQPFAVTITFPPKTAQERDFMENQARRDGLKGERKYILNIGDLLKGHGIKLEGSTDQKMNQFQQYTELSDQQARENREEYFALANLKAFYGKQVPFKQQKAFSELFESVQREIKDNHPKSKISEMMNLILPAKMSTVLNKRVERYQNNKQQLLTVKPTKELKLVGLRDFYIEQIPTSFENYEVLKAEFSRDFDHICNEQRLQNMDDLLRAGAINLNSWTRLIDLFNKYQIKKEAQVYDGEELLKSKTEINEPAELHSGNELLQRLENTTLTEHYISISKQDDVSYDDALLASDKLFAELPYKLPQPFHDDVVHVISTEQPNAVAAHLWVLEEWCFGPEGATKANHQRMLDSSIQLKPLFERYSTLFYKQKPLGDNAQIDVLDALKAVVSTISKMPTDKEQHFWNEHLAAVVQLINDSGLDGSAKKDLLFDALELWKHYSSDEKTQDLAQSLMDLTQSIRFEPATAPTEIPANLMVNLQLEAFMERIAKHDRIRRKTAGFETVMIKVKERSSDSNGVMSSPVLYADGEVKNYNLKSILSLSTRTDQKSLLAIESSKKFAKLEKFLPNFEQSALCSTTNLDLVKDSVKLQINKITQDLEKRAQKSNRFWIDSSKYGAKTAAFKEVSQAAITNIILAKTPHELAAAIRQFELAVTTNKDLTQRTGKFFANTGSVTLVEDVKKFAQSIQELMDTPAPLANAPR